MKNHQLPLDAQFHKQFGQHKQRPHPQVLNVFKKRWLFAFQIVTNELRDPSANENHQRGLPHLVAHLPNQPKRQQTDQRHRDQKHHRQPRVVNHARANEGIRHPRVQRIHQPHQAQHDERNRHKVNHLIHGVPMALPIMPQQLIHLARGRATQIDVNIVLSRHSAVSLNSLIAPFIAQDGGFGEWVYTDGF